MRRNTLLRRIFLGHVRLVRSPRKALPRLVLFASCFVFLLGWWRGRNTLLRRVFLGYSQTEKSIMNEKLPKRKATRLKGYDYKTNGCYFITICSEGRRCIFAEIVGEGCPLPKLTRYGKIVEKWIQRIPQKYPTVETERFIIMPNHIHLLLFLSDACIDGREDPSPTTPSIVNVIAWLKYQITRECNIGGERKKIFQRSFHDHVVRDRRDYEEISRYIEENPLKWELDCFYIQ